MSLKDPVARKAYFAAHYQNTKSRKKALRKVYYEANKAVTLKLEREKRLANRETVNALNRLDYVLRPEYYLLRSARARARIKQLPFNITENDISIPEFCPVLGVKLKRKEGRGMGEESPTLDRIVPSLGYVKGNITVISWRANRLKNNASLADLRLLVAYVEAMS